MQTLLKRAASAMARLQVARRCQIDIVQNAKVNFLGIRHKPPCRLPAGAGSIFEGVIAADRPLAEVAIGRNTFFGKLAIVSAMRVEIGDDVLV